MIIKHYDGCGNTFSIVTYEKVKAIDFSDLAMRVCSHEQLKTDGLIIVKQSPLEMLFYNRDGSYAPMCGNGIRAFAKYVIDEGIVQPDIKAFNVLTGAGELRVKIMGSNSFYCRIDMGQPIFTPEAVKLADQGALSRSLKINELTVDVHAVFMGTIHTVVFVNSIDDLHQSELGKQISEHALFTEKTNVNFVRVDAADALTVRTYERGVGWTLACGTGCCAAYVIAKQLKHVLRDEVTVSLEQGNLIISGENNIYMTGPARYNHTASIDLN